jgi:hypothetical protein
VVDLLESPKVQRLVEDLRRREVPAEAHLSRRAERAGERAAGLGRHADGPPSVAVTHQHGFHRMAVRGVEQDLKRPVAGELLAFDGERRERDLRGEAGAQRRGKVRHLAVARGAARSPLPDLPGAVRRLAGERRLEELEIHGRTVA